MFRGDFMKLILSPATVFYWGLFLLLYHDRTLMAFISAVVVHELTHLIIMWLFGGKATTLIITPMGLTIERSGLLSHQLEFLLSISAPICNLLLAAIYAKYNLNLCAIEANLSFGLINLMPIYPLDGGKALLAILQAVTSSSKATRISQIISVIFLVLFWIFGIAIALVLNGGLSMLMLAIALFISIAPMQRSNK